VRQSCPHRGVQRHPRRRKMRHRNPKSQTFPLPKLPLPLQRLPPKFNTPIPGSCTPTTISNSIRIHSAILSQYHIHFHTTIHQTSQRDRSIVVRSTDGTAQATDHIGLRLLFYCRPNCCFQSFITLQPVGHNYLTVAKDNNIVIFLL